MVITFFPPTFEVNAWFIDAPKRSNTRRKGMDEYGRFTAPMSILIQVLVSKKNQMFFTTCQVGVSRFKQLQLLHLLFLFFRGFFLLSPSFCRLDGPGAHSKCQKLIEIDATGARTDLNPIASSIISQFFQTWNPPQPWQASTSGMLHTWNFPMDSLKIRQ